MRECFDRAKEKLFKISDDKMTVTNVCNKSWEHTIYCQYPIDSMSNLKYEWTFKWKAEGDYRGNIGFGFASNDNCVDIDFCNQELEHIPNYVIYGPGGHKLKNGKADFQPSKLRINAGDTIKIILDLKWHRFSFAVNDGETILAFGEILRATNVRYKMVLQLLGKCSMSIIDFTISE